MRGCAGFWVGYGIATAQRARDNAGCMLVALGYLVMSDECAVEVSDAVASTVAADLGGAEVAEEPAIRPTPILDWPGGA